MCLRVNDSAPPSCFFGTLCCVMFGKLQRIYATLQQLPTMGSCYLGYGLVLYTPITCRPVRILGNDYPGLGTVARLHNQLYNLAVVSSVCGGGGRCLCQRKEVEDQGIANDSTCHRVAVCSLILIFFPVMSPDDGVLRACLRSPYARSLHTTRRCSPGKGGRQGPSADLLVHLVPSHHIHPCRMTL